MNFNMTEQKIWQKQSQISWYYCLDKYVAIILFFKKKTKFVLKCNQKIPLKIKDRKLLYLKKHSTLISKMLKKKAKKVTETACVII